MYRFPALKLLRICCLALLAHSPFSAAAVEYRVDTLADNLDFPWSMTFLPDGSYLVTELGGTLRRIDANGVVGPAIAGLPAVYRAGQGGLFDVTLSPDFAVNNTVYLSFAAGDAAQNGTTVVSAVLQANELTDVTELFSAQPKKYAPLHYGGRLAWMASGDLLLTTGDGFDFREQAQNKTNHFGKTIRIPVNGRAQPEVYSYGHRNPQGLAVTRSGKVLLHEHGPKGGDEVNVIERDHNYGWPAVTFGMDYNGAYVSPFTEYPGMTQPIHVWVPSIAPSGLMIYEGNQFPEWQGDLFVGALVHMEVRHLEMVDGAVANETAVFPEIQARIRDIRQGPDGAIYVITDGTGGRIYRISRAP